MPQLNTEQVTIHTLHLTDDELAALRNAARIALDDDARAAYDKTHGHPDWHGSPDPAAWKAFARLGLPPTRGGRGQPAATCSCGADRTGGRHTMGCTTAPG